MKNREKMMISRRSKRKCTLKNNARKELYKDLDNSFDEEDDNNKKTVFVRPRQHHHHKLTKNQNHQITSPKKFDIVFSPSEDGETEEDGGEKEEKCYSSNLMMLADVLLKYGY